MNELTAVENAQARGRFYALSSRLFLDGVRAELLPYMEDIPALAAGLPPTFNGDEAAAEHQALFSFNVFPYQSIFLDPAGLLGGAESARVQESFVHRGFVPTSDPANPDHIGNELAFLAFLCGAEADAWEDELPETAAHMQHLQSDFMCAHLLRWIAPLVAVIARQDSPFYDQLAQLTQSVLLDHAATAISPSPPEAPFALPAAPDLVSDHETGLHDIAAMLLAPPFSGLFLTRTDLGRMGRRFDLPHGFGERRQLLVNLLRAAGTYDQFAGLCTELATVAADDCHRYEVTMRAYPTLHPWIQPWRDRVRATVAQLNTLAQHADVS